MTTMINFVVENWIIFSVAGLILLPNALWQLFIIIWGGAISGWWFREKELSEPLWRYRVFWRLGVKIDGFLSNWGWKNVVRKLGVAINLITLFWVWGYIATCLVALVGFIARWCWWAIKGLFGGLWSLICKGWEAL